MSSFYFFDSTNHRNLKYKIDLMVKEGLKDYQKELQKRRERLQELLAFENAKYESEIALKLQLEEEDNERRRREWINMHIMQREMKEEEFLKSKNLQRELENSEAVREHESKQILLETKFAQLYQIEEKKALQRRQQAVDKKWLDINQGEISEKKKHAEYEEKLRKVTAKLEQEQNCKKLEAALVIKKAGKLAVQEQELKANIQEVDLLKTLEEREKLQERRNKMHQHDLLAEQINQNILKQHVADMRKKEEGLKQRAVDQHDLAQAWQQHMQNKIQNRERQKAYLAHALSYKQQRVQEAKDLDDLFAGKTCILEHRTKTPYCKQVR